MPRAGWDKRDPERDREAQQWIESVLGIKFSAPYEDFLRDGVTLCNLMNKLAPGSVTKIQTTGPQFKMMDNIENFLKAAEAYGVKRQDLFQGPDLFEKKDISLVTNCLFQLGAATYKHPEWNGPRLGPKAAEANVREFTQEQIQAGKAVIGLQAGSNKGASQSGMNLGNTRHIIHGK